MALITCPECCHNVSDKAFSCPNCGYPFKPPLATSQPIKRRPKRHRKLPNGTGSIKHLSGRRTKEWAAYPPVTEFSLDGSPVSVPAIGYYKNYNEAYQALMLYNAVPDRAKETGASLPDICAAMLSGRGAPMHPGYSNMTFADLYELYFDSKYHHSKKQLSQSSMHSTKAAFNNCAKLHDRKFTELRKADLQDVVDSCPLKHSSMELIVSLFKGMYAYALQNDIVEKDYSKFVSINIPDDDESGVPFSAAAIDTLWQNQDKDGVGMILLMIYTGFRISAFKTIRYDEAGQYFQGGVKTAAGKDRIVPLHPAIQPFAADFVKRYSPEGGEVFTVTKCRAEFYDTVRALGIAESDSGTKHTPHDCRHTFSWLCDRDGVDELSKHFLMGHSLGNDVERSVYGHRTLDELRTEIAKLKTCKNDSG